MTQGPDVVVQAFLIGGADGPVVADPGTLPSLLREDIANAIEISDYDDIHILVAWRTEFVQIVVAAMGNPFRTFWPTLAQLTQHLEPEGFHLLR